MVPLYYGHVNERGTFPAETYLCTNEDVTDLRAVTHRVWRKRSEEKGRGEETQTAHKI